MRQGVTEPGDEGCDVVVVGAGAAGLAAAHRLRDRSVLVLEESERAGGRLRSERHGGIWLNLGAHMMGGQGSPVGVLIGDLGLVARPIRGRLMGLVADGRRLLDAAPEAYPFRMKLPAGARLTLIRAGLRLRLGAIRAQRELAERTGESETERLARLHRFENELTLAAFLGPVHPATERFLRAITERNGADPTEMAAGHGLRSFGNVWSRSAPGNNLVGGSEELARGLAALLGERLRLGCGVEAVRRSPDGVEVETTSGRRIRSRAAILAVPATVAARIGHALPSATRDSLRRVRYGAFLTMAVAVRPGPALPWHGHYAVATPGLSFSVLFNQATTLDASEHRGWGSLMLFRGARGAAELAALGEREVERRFLADLLATFPEVAGRIGETIVQVWEQGAPFSFPGRALLQPALEPSSGPVALAGDYLEFPNLDAAIRSGQAAAERIERYLVEGVSAERVR